MKDNSLYEVRCPNTTWKGNTTNLHCNTLCGKVSSKSMGELFCRKCKVGYNFVINEDGEVTYFFEQTAIKQRYDRQTPEDRLLSLVND